LPDLVDTSTAADETEAVNLSGGVFTVLISVTWNKKIQNSLLFHRFRQKLATSDTRKEGLNCTAFYSS